MTDTALVPVADMQQMAVAISRSGLFGIKTPDQALALMCVAQAEGRHPGIVARDYHIIQGRPTLKADAILARFQEAGGKVEWHRYDNAAVEGTFSHPAGGSLRIAWTMEDAKRAGLAGRDPWKQYPRAMLRARVISEGIRTVYPAVLAGVYTPEEVGDFDAKPPRDMGEVERVEEPPPEPATKGRARRADPTPEPQAPPPDLPPGAKVATTDRPISAAQHRRLEALLKEHGIPRERVKAWLYRRQPALYASAEDVHLDRITPATAEQIEREIPRFVEVLAREEAARSEQADILTAALDAAVESYGWQSDLGDLPRVIEEIEREARAAYQSAHARDKGGPDPDDLARSEQLSGMGDALRRYLASNQPKEQAA